MKKLIILIAVLGIVNCKAQNPIISLEEWDGEEQTNAYYKDLNNELNAFEGTWLYTNGNTSLTIVLEKVTMFFNGDYYEDLIVGEYKYVEDGIEKVNTLDLLNTVEGYNHKIWGNILHDDCYYLPASDCIDGEIRLDLALFDPITGNHPATTLLHKRTVNGQPALNAYIVFRYSGEDILGVPTPEPNMPWQQEYLLIKQ